MSKSKQRRKASTVAVRRPAFKPVDAAATWHKKGLAAYAARDYAKAIGCLTKAVALAPRVAGWHTQLGVALRAAGRFADAVAAHQQAIALDRQLAPAHNNLGNALRAVGEAEAAEAAFREALRLQPGYAEAHCNLGQLLRENGRLEEAEAMFRHSLELRPDYTEALRELGNLCQRRGDFAGAESFFRRACNTRPAVPEAYMELGTALEALGRFDEADQAYDRAVSLAPDHALAHFARARRYEHQGDSAAAAMNYREALKRQARSANAYLSLANLPEGLRAEDKEEITRLLNLPELLDEERSSLLYALARSAERERKWDAAFRWARLANDIDHSRTAFDELENLAFVRRTISTFPKGFEAALPVGSTSERPVFIVGMPRSGTTLVEQIIASHPDAAAGGELVDIPELANRLSAELGSNRSYPECVRDLDENNAQRLAGRYHARMNQISSTALRVTDKLPFNFRHLGLITALFPKARIIHCRRDPRDIAISCYFIKFHRPISFACDLFELGAYLRHYEILTAHWRIALPEILEVNYEDLVADYEEMARRIIDFCGLSWEDRVLRFHELDRTVRTASANQVRRPIYASSIGRWQRYAQSLLPLYAELEGRPGLAPAAKRSGVSALRSSGRHQL